MYNPWALILTFLAGAAIVALLFRVFLKKSVELQRKEAGEKANLVVREAELKALQVKTEAELEAERNRAKEDSRLREWESELQAREKLVKSRIEGADEIEERLESTRQEIHRREESICAKEKELDKFSRLYRMRLHSMSQWDEVRVKQALMDHARKEAEDEVQQLRAEVLGRSEAEVEDHAKRTLLAAMQRIASNPANEASATLVRLETEEMKGRIIGREGRNIRTFESITGTTLMIDESPETVLVSSFDPVRREVARLALERLTKDGRINPATIEETVSRCEEELTRSIQEWGEKALRELRLHSVAPEIVELLGKLHYRLSNNQNTLDHSIEVAFICSLLAAELGLDQMLAKRAGLFHDMGKSVTHEYEGSHAKVGADILRRYGEEWQVINAVAAHHDEVPDESVYAGLVKVADGLSAMRPGARTDTMDSYIRRVKSLEEVARRFKGVQDAYAIQAGREVRVIVSPEEVDDEEAKKLARLLRQRVEDELNYPGSIKITVIRERRFSETAK